MKHPRSKWLPWGAAAVFSCLAPAAEDDAKLLAGGPGKDLVVKICTECHGVSNLLKMRRSRDEWSDEVAEMVDRGAQGSGEELDAIIKYLAANYSKESKVNVNRAGAEELKAALEVSRPEAEALVQYRREKGDYKDWRDLLKVPGVTAKKIESKKDLLEF